MPQLLALLPTLASIGSLAGAGVSIGEAIAGSGGPQQPSPTTPATPQGPTPPNAQALAQQKALVSQQLPNLIGSTSGLANPDYDALMAKILAGVIGQPGSNAAGQGATAQAFQAANSQPNNTPPGQVPNLSDFISSFSG